MSCLSSIKALHVWCLLLYWVLTSPSFSTLMWSSDERLCTLSSGNSALLSRQLWERVWIDAVGPGRRSVREALDQLELGGDLAALVGNLLLGTMIEVSMDDQDRGGRGLRIELGCIGTILERDLDTISHLAA
jgi:hypothetical protein